MVPRLKSLFMASRPISKDEQEYQKHDFYDHERWPDRLSRRLLAAGYSNNRGLHPSSLNP